MLSALRWNRCPRCAGFRNSSQYKRLIYPKWELQPINSYAWRAAPRSSSAPASLGHARAVILWDGFSVEVDGGSNRGAYQAAWANLRPVSQSRAGAFGFLNLSQSSERQGKSRLLCTMGRDRLRERASRNGRTPPAQALLGYISPEPARLTPSMA